MAELSLVFLGAPGCGKGTQAALVGGRLGVPAISTGEMLRAAVAEGTELGQRVERIMAAGELVDDVTMAEVVGERLGTADARDGFILDGYPRTVAQMGALDRILAATGHGLDAVVSIEVPEAELVRRALARRRADDSEEVVRTRLDVYRRKTEPVIAEYRQRGLLREVDGFKGVEEVTDEILSAVAVRV